MKSQVWKSILILIAMMPSCAPQRAATETLATATATKSASSVYRSSDEEPISTDPATFSIASGELQLVEFFSYT